MKKNVCYFLSIIMICFSFIGNVFAADFEVSAVVGGSGTTVTKGSVASIKINIKVPDKLVACSFSFESDKNIEYVSMSGLNGWSPTLSGVNNATFEYDIQNAVDMSNGVNIVDLKYKINDSGSVYVKKIECASIKDKFYQYDDRVINFTAEEAVKNTTLSSLSVSGGVMNPSSITGTQIQYIINLSSTTFGLNMVTSDPKYQDKIVVKDVNGNVISDVSKIKFSDPTGQGMMPLTVTVNDETTYNLLVKYENKNYDNSLKKITINGKEINLTDLQYVYEYTVSKDTTKLEIDAVVSDGENFKIEGKMPTTYTITDVAYVSIKVVPKDSSSGMKSVVYRIDVKKEGSVIDKPSNPPAGGNNGGGNVNQNPVTGDIPMILMGFILVVSLFGSVMLYQKNLQSYK